MVGLLLALNITDNQGAPRAWPKQALQARISGNMVGFIIASD